jgi:polyisoprenoid-binding protein YceI
MTTTQAMPVIASGGYVLDPTASEAAITARGAFDVQVAVAADPSASRAHATFDLSSFQSGNGRRDKNVRNRFFPPTRTPR